ncbi:MAG TPA: glycosyltransferase family 39 protein [Gemmatimonadota bacterium]|nr:glycosyltransferase family 39 protein [Gemmatimonadota bacterium]
MIDWSGVRDPNFRELPPKLGTMGLAMATLAFVLVFVTASDYGIASDVANYLASSLRQIGWFREFGSELASGRPTTVLDREVVFEAWRWYPERIPHPPLARELSGMTWLAAHRWVDTLTAYRLAVMLAYAALAGWVTAFTFWAMRSRLAGLAAGLSVIAYPTLFAHGHLAHTDLFLACFWFMSAASLAVFERTRRIGWLVASGLLLGCAAATKFSGLLLAPVFVVWLLIRRPREALPALVIVAIAAVAVFVFVNPVIWVAPEVGLADYFGAGLDRVDDAMARLRTEYFGVVYEFRPPVHYPWVWTLIVLPPTFLAAIVAGSTLVRRHWLVSFCLLNMGVLYAALLLPWAPMHDGVRLLLPTLAFQCVLVGLGTHRLGEWLSRISAPDRVWLEALALIAILAPAAGATVQSHPYQLSYANLLVGGTAGAAEKGLEVTNLKEVFSPSIVADLDSLIPAGAVVDPGFLTEELCFYRFQGLARDWIVESWTPENPAGGGVTLTCDADDLLPKGLERPAREADFVLVLDRKAVWRPTDRALFQFGGRPAYELSYDGVPLLRVYRTR